MLRYFNNEMTDATLIPGNSGTYVDGVWTPAFDAGTPIRIIVPQPVSANDLQMLEDSEHVRDYLVSWSKTRVMSREGDQDADRITYDGDTYKVMQTDDRSILGRFYRFVMRRLDG